MARCELAKFHVKTRHAAGPLRLILFGMVGWPGDSVFVTSHEMDGRNGMGGVDMHSERFVFAVVVAGMFGWFAPTTTDDKPSTRIKLPVRAWFEPQYLEKNPELYKNMNMITSLTDANLAEKMAKRGVVPLKWCFGPTSEYSGGKADYYTQQCEPIVKDMKFRLAGVGIDEWNPSDKRYTKEKGLAADGYRAARKKWPDNLMVCWVTEPDDDFISLLRDGTFDLAIIEGYTFIPDVGGLTTEGIAKRCNKLKDAKLLDKTIVCFGYIAAMKDKTGRRMTYADLDTQVRQIKKQFPKMPGVAFYGYKDHSPETLDLIQKADELSAELYPTAKSDKK